MHTEPTQPANDIDSDTWILHDNLIVESHPIACGGYGTVFKAFHRPLKKYYAVKKLVQPGTGSRTSFQREGQILAQLNHDGLPEVHDLFCEQGDHYLQMDYIDGLNLDKWVKIHGVVAEDQALEWIEQLLDILDYLHNYKSKIIHCDVKPTNIIIKDEKKVILVDLGIAKIGDFTHPGGHTPGYSPPELVYPGLTNGELDERVDIYGVGATWYYLLTGFPPAYTNDRLPRPRLVPPNSYNLNISPQIAEIIQKALSYYPEDRWSSTKEMLDAISENKTTALETEQRKKKPVAVWARSPRLWVIIGILVLLAVARGIVMVSNNLPTIVEQSLELGQIALKHHEPETALTHFSEAIEHSPDNAQAYLSRGLVYYRLNKNDLAVEDYNQAISLDPDLAEAYVLRGDAHEDQKNYELALEDYNKALVIAPDNPAAYTGRGNVYRQQGNYDAALAEYNRSIELEPNNPAAYSGRGRVYSNQKNYEAALAEYHQAIDLDPSYAPAYCWRGVAHYYLGNYVQEMADYSEAIRLDPFLAEAYQNRGLAYADEANRSDQVDLKQAIKDYTEAITLNYSPLSHPYLDRGNAFAGQRDYDKALADYGEAIKIDPDYLLAYRNRGNTYLKQGNYERAVEDFNKVLELDPKDTLAYNKRGTAHHDMGNYKLAIDDYTQTLKLDPKNTA